MSCARGVMVPLNEPSKSDSSACPATVVKMLSRLAAIAGYVPDATAVTTTVDRSVAVRKHERRTGRRLFQRWLTEEIITALSQLSGLPNTDLTAGFPKG
jgi:hypothetical protein